MSITTTDCKSRPGYDITVSAPMSVSVLWSQADPEARKQIEAIVVAAGMQGVDALNVARRIGR
jgi:hypothetical protein